MFCFLKFNEGNILFNDILNTFYLRLYDITQVLKDQSERKMHHPTDRIAYTAVFVTPTVEHWLEQEIDQRVNHERLIQLTITP